MAEQTVQWEYRVLTVGGALGAKAEQVEAVLNELGREGWEAINVYTTPSSSRPTIVAKRPLTATARRRRSMP
jgi:hypothetical protein